MFTGIVEETGHVQELQPGQSYRLQIRTPLASELKLGDSMAVDGVCLTISELTPDSFWADVVSETIARTNLGERQGGDRVNLERPLSAQGRFDGHIVQGHVDATGEIERIEVNPDGHRISARIPVSLTRYVVEKGTIIINGVALTATSQQGSTLEVALIPHTLAKTNLGDLSVGQRVNLEVDLLAKYVEKMLDR